MIKLKIVFVLIVFFILMQAGFVCANAQVTVTIPDTVIPRGKTFDLNITIDPGNLNPKSIKVILKYNASVIRIVSVRGGPDYMLQCPQPEIKTRIGGVDSAFTEFSCDSLKLSPAGLVAFQASVQALEGSVDTTRLGIEGLYLDNSLVGSPAVNGGHITVTGPHIVLISSEGLGLNTPNPFSGRTLFPFSINKPTHVVFMIFNLNGRLVLSTSDVNTITEIFQENPYRVVDKGSLLEKGSYKLALDLSSRWDISSGFYYLIMKTDERTYNANFIFYR